MMQQTNSSSNRWRWVALVAGAVFVVIGLIVVGYWVEWAGFDGYYEGGEYRPGKTLWDWLGLLIVPAVLTAGGILFSQAQRQNEREIAAENRREEALQGYLDRMSELLLRDGLKASQKGEPVREVARVNTLTILSQLGADGKRKRVVVEFLRGAHLIKADKQERIVELWDADLGFSELSSTYLVRAALDQTNLQGANLREANLEGANLQGANLREANLEGAIVTDKQLAEALSLRGATLRDGSKHPDDVVNIFRDQAQAGS
jgi:uncharacterized protein YjbI with pentapeptide repeats